MNRSLQRLVTIVVACSVTVFAAVWASEQTPRKEEPTLADAQRMIRAAEGTLAPVYAPLAEEIADRLRLSDREGVGVDLGSGPGTLILELCKRTRLHWINADINPYFFAYFFSKAQTVGCAGRVSAILADACALPLRDNFVDVVVSRGSLQFWPDLQKGLSEVHRILKPGGVAYIGRGFPESLPLEVATQIRNGQGEGMKYDPDRMEQQLREAMKSLGIENYRIYRPHTGDAEGIRYGLWLEFHKYGPQRHKPVE